MNSLFPKRYRSLATTKAIWYVFSQGKGEILENPEEIEGLGETEEAGKGTRWATFSWQTL